MSQVNPEVSNEPPRGHARVVYLGPVAPHWELQSDFGDRAMIDAFRDRVMARLVLLPPHDPQFRRNRERVVRDAERENLLLEWDLGLPEENAGLAVATVGVDLGGTKVLVAAVHHGKPKETIKLPTPTGGPEAVAEAIADTVKQVGGAAHVGIGAPGQVHHKTGVVAAAPNLQGWGRDVPLGQLVADALGGSVEVRVDNDVNVAVLGEHRHGAAKGADDVLGAWIGTGIGGGLILDGKLRRGPTGMAGELGHMTVVQDGGLRCGCGQYGHVEAYAGRGRLEAEARRLAEEGTPSALVELAGSERMKSSIFLKALDRGDAVATQLIDTAVVALGAGLASAVNLIDVELIVVGGGLGDKLGAAFAGRIEQAVRERLWAGSSVRVVPSALGDDAGVVGAATLFD